MNTLNLALFQWITAGSLPAPWVLFFQHAANGSLPSTHAAALAQWFAHLAMARTGRAARDADAAISLWRPS